MFDERKAFTRCQELRAGGATIEEVLRYLRENGATPIQSIKALVYLGSSLAEGKRILHFSETWADIREESEELHQRLEDVLNKIGSER